MILFFNKSKGKKNSPRYFSLISVANAAYFLFNIWSRGRREGLGRRGFEGPEALLEGLAAAGGAALVWREGLAVFFFLPNAAFFIEK